MSEEDVSRRDAPLEGGRPGAFGRAADEGCSRVSISASAIGEPQVRQKRLRSGTAAPQAGQVTPNSIVDCWIVDGGSN
jgi:hypothetical protein